jgi:hypothetical protein
LLNPFESQESHFILKFNEMNAKTSVIVLNTDSKPLLDGSDTALLDAAPTTIKADLVWHLTINWTCRLSAIKSFNYFVILIMKEWRFK